MSIVYIGGFAGSQRTACRTAHGIAEYHGWDRRDISPFTFADAMNNLPRVGEVIRDALVFTHSAGMLVLKDVQTSPTEVVAVAPPFPTSAPALVWRSGYKSARLALSSLGDMQRFKSVARINADGARELASRWHDNMRHLGVIARFNALYEATFAPAPVTIVCMKSDAFGFRPKKGTQSPDIYTVRGEHDELLVRPGYVLEQLETAM